MDLLEIVNRIHDKYCKRNDSNDNIGSVRGDTNNCLSYGLCKREGIKVSGEARPMDCGVSLMVRNTRFWGTVLLSTVTAL